MGRQHVHPKRVVGIFQTHSSKLKAGLMIRSTSEKAWASGLSWTLQFP